MNDDVIHYIRDNRRLTADEEKAYNERFKIDEKSEHIHNSVDITQSSYVSHSLKVIESQYVYRSQQVTYSNHIYYSNNIFCSEQVEHSFDINAGTFIVKSSDIANSSNVVRGDNVHNSTYIHSSENIEFCQYVYKSVKAENSMLSGFLTNCTNCLLCFGIEDKQNMLFNQQMSAADISQLRDILRELIEGQNISMVLPTTNLSKPLTYSMNFKTAVDGFNDSFFEILKRLPHYNEFLIKQIFVR